MSEPKDLRIRVRIETPRASKPVQLESHRACLCNHAPTCPDFEFCVWLDGYESGMADHAEMGRAREGHDYTKTLIERDTP